MELTNGSEALSPRDLVLGMPISCTSVGEVADIVVNPPQRGVTVVIANVHTVMTARRTPELAAAVRGSDIVTPDGMPLAWALRMLGHRNQPRVTGFDVFHAALERGLGAGVRHFFYGSTPEVLRGLIRSVETQQPGVQIAGAISPPFRPLSQLDIEDAAAHIRVSEATVLWVGLGMPKQELFMQSVAPLLPGTAIVGIGAVFDWVSGNKPRAPVWMQESGLEWAYRLYKEPRRLLGRYLINNPLFILLLTRELVSRRWGGA